MIELFYADTPNGRKISIMLEEVKLDYKITEIVGHHIVTQNGGKVISIPLTEGFSSTLIIEKIQNG